MSSKDDGGPAFNLPDYRAGMTLLDWFAGQALAGMMVSPSVWSSAYASAVAAEAYTVADAMLAERKRRAGGLP